MEGVRKNHREDEITALLCKMNSKAVVVKTSVMPMLTIMGTLSQRANDLYTVSCKYITSCEQASIHFRLRDITLAEEHYGNGSYNVVIKLGRQI